MFLGDDPGSHTHPTQAYAQEFTHFANRLAFCDFLEELIRTPLPPHMYAFCNIRGDATAFHRAQQLAPIPEAYRDVIVPKDFILVLSSGGVNLLSHVDESGGLLILGKGHAGAHGWH